MNTRNKDILVIIVSIIFSYVILVIGDFYINKRIAINSFKTTEEAFKIEDTRREGEDLLLREKSISQGYQPMIYPSLKVDIYPPLIAGMPKTKTYFCNEGYGMIQYESDRFGFRNEDYRWDQNIEAVFIGDSFVQGACVDQSETLSSAYEILTNRNAINLGIGSNNPRHYLAYAKLFLPKIQPKDVFLVFYANDNGIFEKTNIEEAYIDNGLELFDGNSMELIDLKGTIKRGHQVISILKFNNDIEQDQNLIKIVSSKVFTLFSRHSSLPTIRSLLMPSDQIEDQFIATQNSIRGIKSICDKISCNLNLVFIPNSHFYRPDTRADSYAEKIKISAEDNAILFYDGRDVFDRKQGSLDYAIKGPHLSPLGYLKLAKLITDKDQ